MADSNFIDYVKICCRSGSGGPGSRHYNRTKMNPRGGPDGGDGGKGGDIILQGNAQLWTLIHLKYRKHVMATDGIAGSENRSSGAYGESVILEVPLGTVAKDAETGEVLFEFQEELLKSVFQAPVINEYGCQETGISGLSCPEGGRLHLDIDRCLYEIIDGELVMEGEIAPVVKDQKLTLVLARAEQVFAQSRTSANHLPELHLAFDRLGEDEVHNLRHVDTSVQHVYRNGYAKFALGFFELVNQFFGPWFLRVDDAAKLTSKLWVHLVEEIYQEAGMIDLSREDDGLAWELTVGVADAVVHQVAQNDAVGVFVEDGVVNLLGVEV